MMTSAQVVETSVTITDNSPSQDYTQPDYQTALLLSENCMANSKENICNEISWVIGLTEEKHIASFSIMIVVLWCIQKEILNDLV